MSAPRNLQFIDTNILIYAHDLSAGQKHTRARELILQLWSSGEGCLSIQVLQEFQILAQVARPYEQADHVDQHQAKNHRESGDHVNSSISRSLLQKEHFISSENGFQYSHAAGYFWLGAETSLRHGF